MLSGYLERYDYYNDVGLFIPFEIRLLFLYLKFLSRELVERISKSLFKLVPGLISICSYPFGILIDLRLGKLSNYVDGLENFIEFLSKTSFFRQSNGASWS